MNNFTNKTDVYGNAVRLFQTSEEAWEALTKNMRESGWRVCCFGGYENALVKEDANPTTRKNF